MKKEINVLLTCCNIHVKDIVNCLKNNKEGVKVNVYATNSLSWELPSSDVCEGYVLPRLDEENYIEALIDLCFELNIDIIMPISSIDLDILASHKSTIEAEGIHVSIMDEEKLKFANDKIALYEKYSQFMPKEVIAKNRKDVIKFAKETDGRICCKLANLCGGKGFAVVDDEKCIDIELFHRFGKKHYISLEQLCQVVDNTSNTVILQEYHEGNDYTISILADNGKVKNICGYVGYLLEFGSIMYGEIKKNEKAFAIATQIVEEMGLDGNIGFDFIVKDDGSVILLEINPRINASLPFVNEAGCNMILHRCMQLMGSPIPEEYTIKEGLKMKKYFGTRYYV